MRLCSVLFLLLIIPSFAITQNLSNQKPIQLEAPTNTEINYRAALSNIQVGKAFTVNYTMPASILKIINIDSNITALGDTDIVITNITDKEIGLSVTSYNVQPYPMPSLLITALDLQSNTNVFYTPSFDIPISNDIVSNTNLTFADIEPVYFIWDHLWTIFIVLFILFLLSIYLIPSLFKPKEKKNKEIPIDPFVQVSTKLKKLKTQSLELTEENYKLFFVDLSEIIREFISHTMIVSALELPTSELIQVMKEQKIEEELQELIIIILKNSDRAKYAKQIFSQERIDEVMSDSFKMVQIIKRKNDLEKQNELRKS